MKKIQDINGWNESIDTWSFLLPFLVVLIISVCFIIYVIYNSNEFNENEIKNQIEGVGIFVTIPVSFMLLITWMFSRFYDRSIIKYSKYEVWYTSSIIEQFLKTNGYLYKKLSHKKNISTLKYLHTEILYLDVGSIQIRIEKATPVAIWLGPIKHKNKVDIYKLANELNQILD